MRDSALMIGFIERSRPHMNPDDGATWWNRVPENDVLHSVVKFSKDERRVCWQRRVWDRHNLRCGHTCHHGECGNKCEGEFEMRFHGGSPSDSSSAVCGTETLHKNTNAVNRSRNSSTSRSFQIIGRNSIRKNTSLRSIDCCARQTHRYCPATNAHASSSNRSSRRI